MAIPGDIDILAPWFNIIRDMRRRGMTAGYAVLSVKIIVDKNGAPVIWLEPEVSKISPLSAGEVMKGLLNGKEIGKS